MSESLASQYPPVWFRRKLSSYPVQTQQFEKVLRTGLQNKHIDYILFNSKTNNTYVLASDNYDDAIEFTPYTKTESGGYTQVPEWDYNFDYYIYNYLEEVLKIGYMTDDVHYSIWNSINELYPNDIEYKNGVQEYLQYCKGKNITKEYLDKKTGLNTPNIMKYYKSH